MQQHSTLLELIVPDEQLETPISPMITEPRASTTSTPLNFETELMFSTTTLNNWLETHGWQKCNSYRIPNTSNGTVILQDMESLQSLKLIEDANVYQMVNLPPDSVKIAGTSGYIVDFVLTDQFLMRFFAYRSTYTIVVYLLTLDCEIPFCIKQFKRNKSLTDEAIRIPSSQCLIDILTSDDDFTVEADQASIKYGWEIPDTANSRKLDCIRWFTERKKKIKDLNHLLKIDKIIFELFPFENLEAE